MGLNKLQEHGTVELTLIFSKRGSIEVEMNTHYI